MNHKRQKATALRYDEKTETAPKITASGSGLIAENIIREAKSHNVPVVEDESLVELLGELNINEKIPEELYQVVAEVFAFIYKIDKMQDSVKN